MVKVFLYSGLIYFTTIIGALGQPTTEFHTRILIDENIASKTIPLVQAIEKQAHKIINTRKLNDVIDPKSLYFSTTVSSKGNFIELYNSSEWDFIFSSETNSNFIGNNNLSKAFSIPFAFDDTESLIQFQNSAPARADLSRASNSEFIGISYLNFGSELAVTPLYWNITENITGSKIADPSGSSFNTLTSLGAHPVRTNFEDIGISVLSGNVESFLISTASSEYQKIKEISGMKLYSSILSNQTGRIFVRKKSYEKRSYKWRTLLEESIFEINNRNNQNLINTEKLINQHFKNQGFEIAPVDDATSSLLMNKWLVNKSDAEKTHYNFIKSIVDKEKNIKSNKSITNKTKSLKNKIYYTTTRDENEQTIDINFRFEDGRKNTDKVKCGEVLYNKIGDNQYQKYLQPKQNTDCNLWIENLFKTYKTITIFVHGYANSFTDAVDRSIFLNEQRLNNSAIVLWSWPSKKYLFSTDYDYDKESATGNSTVSFKRLVSHLSSISEKDGYSLNIISHSMGAWHTLTSLQHIDSNSNIINQLILAAPDVPKDEFSTMMNKVGELSNRSTLYSCAGDLALKISTSINEYPRAGSSEPEISIHKFVDSIDVDPEFFSINHSYVFEWGNVADDLIETSRNKDIDNRDLTMTTIRGNRYWKIP